MSLELFIRGCLASNLSLSYCSELATLENALLAFDPIKRTVPTTSTRITANITAYSAISCPDSSDQSLRISLDICSPPRATRQSLLSEKDCLGTRWTHDARSPQPLSNVHYRFPTQKFSAAERLPEAGFQPYPGRPEPVEASGSGQSAGPPAEHDSEGSQDTALPTD